MRWSALARLLFVVGVAYCAYMLRPLGGGPALNLAFSLILAGLIIYLEERLHHTSLANVFGALLGGACGLLIARMLGAALFWANTGDTRVVFTHLAAPAMTRLRQEQRQVLDTLVDSGVARSRSEALAWCVQLVGEHADAWLGELRTAMAEVDKLRSSGPGL